MFSTKLPWEARSKYGLPLELRRRLRQLVIILDYNREEFLAQRLNQFLEDDREVGCKKTFGKAWLDLMAEYIDLVMEDGKALYIR